MESTENYLTRKHGEIIRNRYVGENCGVIALTVARRLIAEGETPHIKTVYEERRLDGFTTIVKQVPLFLKDEIEPWHAHQVCCTDNQAYDPLLGKPVKNEEYCTLLFGEEIKMKVSTPKERVLDEIDTILS